MPLSISGHDMSHLNQPAHEMPGHDMPMCSMNMIFTWDTTDLCVVFKWWHVRTNIGLVLTLLSLVALAAGYELLRKFIKRYSQVSAKPPLSTAPTTDKHKRLAKAILYGIQVFYSFWLMLVFMTYNGWAMLAVVVGAAIGHFLWGDDESLDMHCH